MAKPDWLSIEEISRLWGEETGSDPAAFKQDLEAWFAAFVKQSPGSQSPVPGKSADTTNRLMGMLGARYLERQTFEAYCEERGHPKPQFWFSGRIEESQRDATRQPEATPPRRVEEPPAPGPAGDPELASFQTQIASMSERLKPPSFEFRKPGPSSAGDPPDRSSQPAPSGPSTENIHQELIERADAASAEARQLEAQLDAAEQRIAELGASTQASQLSSPAHSGAPDAASPTAQWQGATAHSPHAQQDSASYQDPSATGQRLRHGARRKGRGRAALVAGLAVSLAAVAALVIWGTESGLIVTDNAPASSPSETTEWNTGAGSTDGATRDLAATVAPADPQDLAAAQRQIARLTAAVEASSSEAARLRDELAIARQTLESVLQVPSTGADAEEQQRKLALAAAEEASNLRAALAGAEQKIAALDTQLEAARRATSTARAETARLRTAMLQAKGQTDAELRVLSLATTASSARIAALQRDLASARREIIELGGDKDAAAADATGLRASLQSAQAETEALREELDQEVTSSSTRVAGLRKELSAAQLRIDELEDAAGAAAQGPSLRADLAAAERKIAGHDDELQAARVTAVEAERKITALREELEATRDAAADADTKAAEAQADAARLRTALRQAKDQTGSELHDQSLAVTVSSARVAELQRDLASARQQIVDLGRDRSAASADASGLQASLERAQEQTEALREELALKVTASSAQLATLRKDLRSAELRIAELSEELAAGRQAESATGSPSTKPVEAETSAPSEEAAERAAVPEIAASSSAETNSSDPASGSFEQVAALAPNQAALLTDAIADTVSPDDLLLAPGRHLGQEVVVTGSVVWLLWRYRLQSNNGSDSMVVDVDGLQPATQQELEKAIDRVGILGEVQARIRGTVVRKDEESYRLAASELVLAE
jgi:predicted  nucleic acid-binding Zn-ribbon protein